jgi:O-antigen ligase
LIIFPWGIELFSTVPKAVSLYIIVLSTWTLLLIKRKYWENNFKQPLMKVEIIVSIFVFLIVLSTFYSVNKLTSIFGVYSRFEGIITLISYISIFVFSYRIMNIKQWNKIIPDMVVVSFFVSIYGILQHYSIDFLPNSGIFGDKYTRSYALFNNPNFFGSYIVLVIMLSIALYISSSNKKFTAFIFISTSLTFTAMLFSGTRSAWVGSFLSVVFITVFVVLKRKYLWRKWGILLISFATIFIIINSVEEGGYLNRFISTFTDSSKIITNKDTGREGSNRIYIWSNSIPLLKEYFWLGSGPDTFIYVFPNDTDEGKEIFGDQKVDKAHNEYLQIAVTLGIPALLTYLLLLLAVLRKGFKAVRVVHEKDKILIYGLISAIIGYLIQAFFNISVVQVAPLFWSILGITYGISTYHLNKAKEPNTAGEINKQVDVSA